MQGARGKCRWVFLTATLLLTLVLAGCSASDDTPDSNGRDSDAIPDSACNGSCPGEALFELRQPSASTETLACCENADGESNLRVLSDSVSYFEGKWRYSGPRDPKHGIVVLGLVYNSGSQDATFDAIVATAYHDDGSIIGEGSQKSKDFANSQTRLLYRTLLPGQTSPFGLTIEAGEGEAQFVDRIEFSITEFTSGAAHEEPADLGALSVEIETATEFFEPPGPETAAMIVGKVVNAAHEAADIRLFLATFDASGRVTAIGQQAYEVPAGSASDFRLTTSLNLHYRSIGAPVGTDLDDYAYPLQDSPFVNSGMTPVSFMLWISPP